MGLCFGSLTGRESHTTFNSTHHSGWGSSDESIRKMKVGSDDRTSNLVGNNYSGQHWEEIWRSGSVNSNDGSSPPNTIVTHSGQIILETAANLKVFSFAELKAATKGFKSEIGEGGFGKVYKGWLHHTTLSPAKPASSSSAAMLLVAIKKLNPESVQGFQEWKSEINFLGKFSHPNLVKLLGYCWENEELLLVYEFMPKGSLENHLFRRNSNIEPLSWNTRLKIAIGAARGLAVLHTSEKQVIYRDFKTSNILLDGDYNAKISDFGLAKLGPVGEDSHVTTRIMGTYGYAAPEYMATGHLYVKSDVYGFGVVLLEMMTGLRALDPKRPQGQQNLVLWAKPFLSDKRSLKSIMDSKMKGQYSLKAAFQAAQLALKCLQPHPQKRPPINDVLKSLQDIQAIKHKQSSKNESMKRRA